MSPDSQYPSDCVGNFKVMSSEIVNVPNKISKIEYPNFRRRAMPSRSLEFCEEMGMISSDFAY
jgi:hypothetical protein